MDHQETWTELLERLRPLLEKIFAEHGVPPREAQQIVEETFLVLMSKRPQRKDPEGWVLRTILAKCQAVGTAPGRGGERNRL
jgi:DNA-directed RNA polymerase specialized sigma24 family protein